VNLYLALVFFLASTSTNRQPVVSFATPGQHAVTLKVCNRSGCSSVTKTVTVLDPVPRLVTETVPTTVGTADPPVVFSATAAGRPPISLSWSLTLPDRSITSATGSPYTWSAPRLVGLHQLGLRLTNPWGSKTVSTPFNVIPTVFSDVSPAFSSAAQIETFYYSGLLAGVPSSCVAGAFCPAAAVNRAQAAAFLVRATHPPPFTLPPAVGIFPDVARTYWAAAFIEQLNRDHNTLAEGCPAGLFCPESLLSRAEIAVLLERAVHPPTFKFPAPTGLFADVPRTYWAAPWIEQLMRDRITSGCGLPGAAHLYCPEGHLTRADLAVFFVTAFHLVEIPTPTAFLATLCSASSCSYPAGMPVSFAVQVTGGIPTAYDYDWNGDGLFEETAAFPVAHTFSPGTYTPRLRLRRGASSTMLSHPIPIRVLAASTTTPPPPTAISFTATSFNSPAPQDPPGTPLRIGYRFAAPAQAGVLGYAVFVNPGAGYTFAGLLRPNRPTATDQLLLLPPDLGAVRFAYVRSFNATGYGPPSLPVRLP
jgi:PKD repeat protein